MGYYMQQRNSSFKIKKENFEKALAAVRALNPDEGGSGDTYFESKVKKHFAWVDTDEYKKAESLHEAVEAWRWQLEFNDEGDCNEIWFEGEKHGDDNVLFKALAPYVEAGSYIEMLGEDGFLWKWDFDGKTVQEKTGRVVYE